MSAEKRSDVTVRCQQGHVMQRFRWMTQQGVWHPTRGQDQVIAVYPGGAVGVVPVLTEDDEVIWPAPDHWKWPLFCNRCVPRQTRTVRDDRMSLVLTLLSARGETDIKMAVIDGILSNPAWLRPQ